MTTTHAVTPTAERAAVVQQDLQNVLHPMVPHRQIEAEPLVIVEGRGSTVVDADGTAYLDAMAGLWCVNIGYGRTGKMFAHQHYGVQPDMVTVAKGLVSAYLPIAATVVRNHVFQSFVGAPSENRQVFQISTYGDTLLPPPWHTATSRSSSRSGSPNAPPRMAPTSSMGSARS